MSVTGRALGLEGKEERVFLSLVGWRSGSQGNMSQGWSGSQGKHVSRLVRVTGKHVSRLVRVTGETCLKVGQSRGNMSQGE